MTRNGDTNGDGPAQRRWHRRPMVMPVALVCILMGTAFGYGRIAALGAENSGRIDRFEERTLNALEALNRKLDKLFAPRVSRHP